MKQHIDRRAFLQVALGGAALAALPASLGCDRARSRPTAYLFDEIFLAHDTGENHIERPERLTAIDARLRREDWYASLLRLETRVAERDEIALVHDPAYIALVREEVEAGRRRLSTGDTPISAASYVVARHAVGGVLSAVDAVMTGRAKNAFCAVRPPGHHATPDRGMGFCIFNSIAIAARYAQHRHGVGRVLIADWDVHHGNGTQDAFYSDGTVFFMSTHQSPFYPRTGAAGQIGEGAGEGLIMNRPFAAGAGNAELIGAFRDELLPAARRFRPELTLVSAGFDARADDLRGGFLVDDDGFRELTRIMLEIAHISGGGRLVSVLEGGYNIEGSAEAAAAHVDELVRA